MLIVLFGTSYLEAKPQTTIRVYVSQPTVRLSKHLYGLFYEDINFSADGGLYAELVQNRSFEYHPVAGWNPLAQTYHPLYAWEKVERGGGQCSLSVERGIPLNRNNPHYLVVRVGDVGEGVGVKNLGFNGIRLEQGHVYDVSFYARSTGKLKSVTVSLESETGDLYGSFTAHDLSGDWQKITGTMTSQISTNHAQLVLIATGEGELSLDMVSLFPRHTFGQRKNGLRADLVQSLKDLQPKFFRFPGGCIAHGHGLENAYRWQDTVGDVVQRRGNWNLWGYHQTYGLGYYEYFLLCEDIGATPLPVLPVGVSCGFRPPFQCVPMGELEPWIQDCLDLIEFANGPVESQWGKLRADMGHPQPFDLQYICLGNEEHDTPECRERFPLFVKAIRKAYPHIKIIGTSGLGHGIPLYDLMTDLQVYSSDEHYYESPQWYLQNTQRFDSFDRSGPKIFVGEYASRGNTLFNAVAEAAYLTGIERNGDIVDMACYAPLFAHEEFTQWRAANLIQFNQQKVVKTANYYVQQLFSRNKGDVYLKNEVVQPVLRASSERIQGCVGIGTWLTAISLKEARVNDQLLDVKDWHVAAGDFSLLQGNYLQQDLEATPAMSISEKKFAEETVTYRVRVKQTRGAEGFLLVFGYQDPENYYWWNIGGWNNVQHGIEQVKQGQKTTLTRKNGKIKPNVWYDAKVVLSPGRIRCYLNDDLVHDYRPFVPGISLSATRDTKQNDLILKLVNPTDQPQDTQIHLDGLNLVTKDAQLTVLRGGRNEMNSMDRPDQIKPLTRTLRIDRSFQYVIPAMSVQVIRLHLGES